jgi:hypothetical protein
MKMIQYVMKKGMHKMSRKLFDNIKNIPANLLAFLLLAITPTTLTDYSIFQDELLKDEEILWIGKPETKFILYKVDVVLALSGLLCVGCGLLILNGFITSEDLFRTSRDMFFSLVGCLFFSLGGLYLIFGRYYNNNYEKKRTFYAVTNQRVLIITYIYTKNVIAKFINQIPALIKNVRKDGVGTIQFDNYQYIRDGEDIKIIDVPTFHDIKDVDTVYKLINDLRRPR